MVTKKKRNDSPAASHRRIRRIQIKISKELCVIVHVMTHERGGEPALAGWRVRQQIWTNLVGGVVGCRCEMTTCPKCKDNKCQLKVPLLATAKALLLMFGSDLLEF